MKIIDICKYNGRNIFSHKPVVRMTVDIGELAEVSTNQIVNFNQRLLERFPGLKTHYCSLGYEGGFVDRLEEGTLVSHVTEHLALELQCIIGYDVYFGKTRIAQEPSVYCIVYEYINGYCAEKFGQAAVEIISGLACKKAVPIRRIIRELREYATEYDLGPSTQAIWNEARRRNIPVTRLGDGSLLQLGYGKYIRYLEASLPDTASSISVDLAKNKQLSKDLLKKHNLPVPEGGVVHSEDEAVLLAHDLGYPIAIKPLDGNQGKGVTTNIDNEISLRKAYNVASDYSDRIMVEKCISGKDYRILVVGDQVAAAAERRPPLVIGDGIRSIAELVEKENRNPNRGDGHEKPLTKINIDEVSKELLSRSNLTEQSVPGKGEVIYLRENGNLSTGGSARDCTAEIHPVNKNIAIRAAKAIGLEIAGIDVVAKDISQPLTLSNGAIIEINAAPGLRMHLYPTEGQATNVAANILDYMYPPGTPCSIPIVSVTGTNGKTTVTRIIYHVLSLTGQKVGMTCSSGTYIGSECISRGDNTGPVSAQSILSNKEVEVAVLETARGGIIKRGLGYDLADVGIVTNVSEDHLGLNGINSVEDMAFVKAL
ncbi:MAG: cyanophycin synthetase, partial [Syntrophomonadaceae bacterium]